MAAISHFPKPKNDFVDTTAQFVSEKPFSAAKAGYVFIDVLKEADMIPEGQKEGFASVRHHLNLIKLARAPGELLRKTNEFRHSVVSFLEEPSFGGFAKVVRDGNGTISPVWDGVDFLTKAIVHIPKDTPWVQNLKGINGSALVFSMAWNICDNLCVLANSKLSVLTDPAKRSAEFTKVGKALIDLARDVSLIVLGVMTVLTVFFGWVFAPVVATAWSASSVVFTLIGFYHKNWGADRKEEF